MSHARGDRGFPGGPAAGRGGAGRGLPHRRPPRAAGAYEVTVVAPAARAAQRLGGQPRARAGLGHGPRRRSTRWSWPAARACSRWSGDEAFLERSARWPGARAAWPACARARSCWPPPGLLEGRRATTHWAGCALLARAPPGASRWTRTRSSSATAACTPRRRDRRHGPGARARRGGPRPRDGARDGTLARALRQAPGRPGSVQRPAHRAARRAPPAARAPGLDRRQPGRGPLRAGARRARPHERAQLRPRLRARGGHDPGRVRRGRPRGERADGARGGGRPDRARGRRVPDSAPSRPCAARFTAGGGGPRRLPPPLPLGERRETPTGAPWTS